ncbi:hypothetical protein IT568_12780 [bacterium]|nr:hypothetical protein [bacterium]
MKFFKKNIKLLFLIILLVFGETAFTQDLNLLEKDYLRLKQKLEKEQLVSDSLNLVLKNEAEELDKEKNKPKPKVKKLEKLMAKTLTTSEDFQKQQLKTKKLEGNFESLKRKLSQKYVSILDSLKELKHTKEVEKQILIFTEKRLSIDSGIQSLDFDFQKISQIKFTAEMDSLEKRIFVDYLEKAFLQIKKQIVRAKETRKELEEVIFLREKMNEFLEDVENEEGLSLFTSSKFSRSNSEVAATDLNSGEPGKVQNLPQSLTLFRQLNLKNSSLSENKNVKISQGDYVKLLLQAEEKLEEIKETISKKLEQSK